MVERVLILFAIACSLNIGTILAQPSLNGSTGLFEVPTADIVRNDNVSIGAYSYDNYNMKSIGVNINPKIELTGVNIKGNGDTFNKLNIKYIIASESVLSPGYAIGINDLTSEQKFSPFFVLSKGLPLGFRIHAGVGGGSYNNGFVAIEKNITPHMRTNLFPSTNFIVEYDGKNTNYGVRMSMAQNVKFNLGRCDNKTFIGLTYAK